MERIINSLLSNDLYKFSMGQAIFHQHNGKRTHWTFKCRNKGVHFTGEMVNEIKRQIELYSELRFTEEELNYLRDNYIWIHQDYIDYLKFWHPVASDIVIGTNSECGLTVEFEGSATNVSPYETPIMAIICEVYYRLGGQYEELLSNYKESVEEMIKSIKENPIGNFSDFGFRRRLSSEAQDYLIKRFTEEKVTGFIGTSNVYLAMKYGIRAMGTMAHEWVMLVGQGYPEYNPSYSNKFMMDSWVKEYGVLNGIALTDTIGTPCFLKDFQKTYATLFSGVRHDSGDPIEWGNKMIAHYESLGIDPKTKTLLFSDSLTLEKARMLNNTFSGRANVAFGIGGALCSPKGHSLNIVIKTTEVDGNPVAKLSDDLSKGICKDEAYIEYLKKTVDWRLTQ